MNLKYFLIVSIFFTFYNSSSFAEKSNFGFREGCVVADKLDGVVLQGWELEGWNVIGSWVFRDNMGEECKEELAVVRERMWQSTASSAL